jgi:hypothetical protein
MFPWGWYCLALALIPLLAASPVIALAAAFLRRSSLTDGDWFFLGSLTNLTIPLCVAMLAIWLIVINVHRRSRAWNNASAAPRWYRFARVLIVLVVAALCVAYVAAHILIFIGGCRLRYYFGGFVPTIRRCVILEHDLGVPLSWMYAFGEMFFVLAMSLGALVMLILLVMAAIYQVWLLICQVWSRSP